MLIRINESIKLSNLVSSKMENTRILLGPLLHQCFVAIQALKFFENLTPRTVCSLFVTRAPYDIKDRVPETCKSE